MDVRRVAVVFAMVLGVAAPAGADCPGPSLTARRHVSPGETVAITGDAFGDCNDTGGFCTNVGVSPPPSVYLSVIGEEGEIAAQEVAPDDHGWFRAEMLVPSDAAPGEYEILATPSDSAQPTATTRIVVE